MRTLQQLTLIAALGLCVLSGCGRNAPDESSAAPEQPQVDPRFASAEALVQHYNSLSTVAPVKFAMLFELFYPETDGQRRYIEATRKMGPIAELDYLMFEKFGSGWDKAAKKPMLAPDQPAKITKVEDQRAEASLIDSDGKKKSLMLVKIGDRWWVSGYTIEHDPSTNMNARLKEIDQLGRLVDAMAAAEPAVADQIRAGVIKSADAARAALMKSAMANAAPATAH